MLEGCREVVGHLVSSAESRERRVLCWLTRLLDAFVVLCLEHKSMYKLCMINMRD